MVHSGTRIPLSKFVRVGTVLRISFIHLGILRLHYLIHVMDVMYAIHATYVTYSNREIEGEREKESSQKKISFAPVVRLAIKRNVFLVYVDMQKQRTKNV